MPETRGLDFSNDNVEPYNAKTRRVEEKFWRLKEGT
jgi:hypothetical protein